MMLSFQIAGGILIALATLAIGYMLIPFFGQFLDWVIASQQRADEKEEGRNDRNRLVHCVSMLKKAKKRGDAKQIAVWERNLLEIRKKLRQ